MTKQSYAPTLYMAPVGSLSMSAKFSTKRGTEVCIQLGEADLHSIIEHVNTKQMACIQWTRSYILRIYLHWCEFVCDWGCTESHDNGAHSLWCHSTQSGFGKDLCTTMMWYQRILAPYNKPNTSKLHYINRTDNLIKVRSQQCEPSQKARTWQHKWVQCISQNQHII